MKARSSLLLLLTVVLALGGAGSLSVWKAKRQYALNSELIDALVHNDNKQALALVQQGAAPNTPQTVTPAPTLLQLFRQLMHRSPPPAKNSSTAFLLACGALPTGRTIQETMAYHSQDDALLVQAMLLYGADVQATNNDGQTALFNAVQRQHLRSAQLLLNYGANVNATDGYGMTPLMMATVGSDVDTVRCLLEHGASVTHTNQGGETALHYALFVRTDTRIVRLLLAKGAAPNTRDVTGMTPLKIAYQQNRPDMVALLRGKR